jgi:hypothetical protein
MQKPALITELITQQNAKPVLLTELITQQNAKLALVTELMTLTVQLNPPG